MVEFQSYPSFFLIIYQWYHYSQQGLPAYNLCKVVRTVRAQQWPSVEGFVWLFTLSRKNNPLDALSFYQLPQDSTIDLHTQTTFLPDFPTYWMIFQSSLRWLFWFDLGRSKGPTSSYCTIIGFNSEILPVGSHFSPTPQLGHWTSSGFRFCDGGADVREVMAEGQWISRPWESLQSCWSKQTGKPLKGFQ